MKVIFLSKYGYAGASSRYRFYNYKKYFDSFDCEYRPLLSDQYIDELYKGRNSKILLFIHQCSGILKRIFYLLFSSSNNLYIIEKELFPNIPYFFECLLLTNKHYCLDFDDYVGASYSENTVKRIFLKNKLSKLVSKSMLTTVGNKWYFHIFNNHPSLFYLPTNIEIEKYEEFVKFNVVDDHEERFSLVWIGSKSTSRYLEIIKPAFLKLAEKYNILLFVIGGIAPFEHQNIEYLKWDESSEAQNIAKADVGIMPLADTLWEKGKCGFKLIQYMGVGLPVLGSSSPANEEIIYENGFICHDSQDWFDKIEYLIVNKQQREELGKKSLVRAREFYSYTKWGPIYEALIIERCKLIKEKKRYD